MTIKKLLTLATVATGLGLASMAGSAADTPAVAVAKCSDLVFHKEFLDKYPRAPAVCQSVSIKNGVKSAKFSAKVVSLDKGSVKVQFLNVAGDPVAGMEPLVFTPAPGAKLYVNGKSQAYKDLKSGDKLNIYLPEGRVGVVTDPDEAGDK